MPYVQRTSDGQIIALFAEPAYPSQEFITASHPSIAEFLALDNRAQNTASPADEALKAVLTASDLRSIRIIDDLVEALLERGVITLTDLPDAARSKLIERKRVRSGLSSMSQLLDEDEGLV